MEFVSADPVRDLLLFVFLRHMQVLFVPPSARVMHEPLFPRLIMFLLNNVSAE